MKFCNKCGAEVHESDSFCGQCGQRIHQAPEQRKRTAISTSVKDKTTITPPQKKGLSKSLSVVITALVLIGAVILALTYFSQDTTHKASSFYPDRESGKIVADAKLPPYTARDAKARLLESEIYPVHANTGVQILEYHETIKVSLPPGFSDVEQQLTLSKASVDESIWIDGQKPIQLIDVSLSNNDQPAKPVEISFEYDAGTLDPNLIIEEQLSVYRWDQEGGGWVSLPTRSDPEEKTIAAHVNHFSLVGLFAASAIIYEGVTNASKLGEQLLNDRYVTSNEHFLILYDKEVIENHQNLNDQAWQRLTDDSARSYEKRYPKFVQDVGYYLEHTLNAYEKLGIPNPAAPKKGFFGTYNNKITVKLGSYLSEVMGDPYFDKVYEGLHIPLLYCVDPKEAKITLAHELFHRLQADYYGVMGMAHPGNKWFLEATAEYAAYDIAWPALGRGMISGCGNNYLSFAVNSNGSKKGSGVGWTERKYEYITSIFIKFLTHFKVDLVELIIVDAGDNQLPKHSINNYLAKTTERNLVSDYRSFTHFMLFSNNSPIKKFPLTSSVRTKQGIASYRTTWDVDKSSDLKQTITVDEIFSSKVWGIQIKADKTKKGSSHVLAEVIEMANFGQSVDFFVLPKGNRYLSSIKPVASLKRADQEALIEVNAGDWIYVVAINGFSAGEPTIISLKNQQAILSIDPPELENAVANHLYTFQVEAEQIPKTVVKVNLEWDFGDGKKESTGIKKNMSVYKGEAETKIKHQYDISTQEQLFLLKAVLRDASTGIILAAKEVPVTLPNKPSVFITERHIIGPPGATFDLTAKASPTNTYRFVWEISELGEQYQTQGKESTIAPVIYDKGKFVASVILMDLENNLLDEDEVYIKVELENDDYAACKGKVYKVSFNEGIETAGFKLLTFDEVLEKASKENGQSVSDERYRIQIARKLHNTYLKMTDNSFNKQNLKRIPNLSNDCFQAIVNGKLNILYHGIYKNHKTGEILSYKDGQLLRVIKEKKKTTEGSSNPFGGVPVKKNK